MTVEQELLALLEVQGRIKMAHDRAVARRDDELADKLRQAGADLAVPIGVLARRIAVRSAREQDARATS